MESLNDFYDYDIESPSSSEIKTAAIMKYQKIIVLIVLIVFF